MVRNRGKYDYRTGTDRLMMGGHCWAYVGGRKGRDAGTCAGCLQAECLNPSERSM